jgi:hypothetical protein
MEDEFVEGYRQEAVAKIGQAKNTYGFCCKQGCSNEFVETEDKSFGGIYAKITIKKKWNYCNLMKSIDFSFSLFLNQIAHEVDSFIYQVAFLNINIVLAIFFFIAKNITFDAGFGHKNA